MEKLNDLSNNNWLQFISRLKIIDDQINTFFNQILRDIQESYKQSEK